MALPAKKALPNATASTAKTSAATAPSPSAPASSSEPAPAPAVPVLTTPPPAEPGQPITLAELTTTEEPADQGPTPSAPTEVHQVTESSALSSLLDAPAPVQNDVTADLLAAQGLPPKPANLPDGGDCHIIWPGEAITIKGHVGTGGLIITDCRHYEAALAPGSRTRWTFRLLYSKGVEVKDRRLIGQLVGRRVVPVQGDLAGAL